MGNMWFASLKRLLTVIRGHVRGTTRTVSSTWTICGSSALKRLLTVIRGYFRGTTRTVSSTWAICG